MAESQLIAKWIAWTPHLRSVLRIVAGYMFMELGAMKLFGFPTPLPEGQGAALWSQAWFGGMIEFCGGVLMLIGLFTRPAAFILSGTMAVAYWQFHAPQSPWISANYGFGAALACFVWLYFSAAGPGPWSVDAVRGKR